MSWFFYLVTLQMEESAVQPIGQAPVVTRGGKGPLLGGNGGAFVMSKVNLERKKKNQTLSFLE